MGFWPAHTPEELKCALSWAIAAPDGSGALQTFGSFVPIARPQECMFTQSHIDIYRKVGIEAVSLYYSAIPFNAFGSFIPELSAQKRYNPLTLKNPATGASIRLIPAINQGDLAEYFFSAARMLKAIRAEQLREPRHDATQGARQPVDMLVVLDMDADDTFWAGFVPRFSRRFVPSFGGLYSLIKSIAHLPFVGFERPWEYLNTHPDRGEISIGQDMADGAFDGYSSWSEKYENYEIWSIIASARARWEAAKDSVVAHTVAYRTPLVANLNLKTSWFDELEEHDHLDAPLVALAQEAMQAQLRALSTTHFGLAAPVMNAKRLEKAREAANRALESAEALYRAVKHEYEYTDEYTEAPKYIGTKPNLFESPEVQQDSRQPFAFAIDKSGEGQLTLEPDPSGQIRLARGPHRVAICAPWVEYGHRIYKSREINVKFDEGYYEAHGLIPLSHERKAIEWPHGRGRTAIYWRRTARMLSADLVRFDIHVQYPQTPHRRYNRKKAMLLGRTWDARWQQVAPFEIIAFENVPLSTIIHVWKEDFAGVITCYSLDYAGYGRNRYLADINNHLTPQWLALSDGVHGILVAQTPEQTTQEPLSPTFQPFQSFAFCPLRQDLRTGAQRISMLPFGALWGPQYRYPSAVTGLGRLAAICTAEHLHSSAPSWEGRTLEARLLVALYEGDAPPERLLAELRQ